MLKKLLFWLIFFGNCTLFSQKPILVFQKNKIWYVMNNRGNRTAFPADLTIPNPVFCFQNGYFLVEKRDKNRQIPILLNEKLEEVFVGNFDFNAQILTPPDDFGLFLVRNPATQTRFVCDLNGQIRSPEQGILQYLGKGIVAYPLPDEGKRQYFMLFDALKNQKIKKIETSSIEDMSEDRIPFFTEDDESDELVGFLDPTGREIIPPRYEPNDGANEIAFWGGLVALQRKEKTYIFNRSGMVVYQGDEFQEIANNGYFKTEGESGVFLHNNNGVIVNTFGLFDCGDVNKMGCFFFKGENSAGVMNINGQTLVRGGAYTTGTHSDSHIFLVKNNGMVDVFDVNGSLVNSFEATWVREAKFGWVLFGNNQGEQGIANESGMVVLTPRKVQLLHRRDGYFAVSDGGKYSLYDENGKQLFKDVQTELQAQTFEFLFEKGKFLDY